jgi:hypothetical protein
LSLPAAGQGTHQFQQRFTTERTALRPPEAVLAACSEGGYTTWRDRVLTPVTTVQLFL